MTLVRPNVRGSDCPSESPCPTTSPSPSPYSPTDFGHLIMCLTRGSGPLRDGMMTATRQEVDLICQGYARTSGCGLEATLTVASLMPCMIPSLPLLDLCERCWQAMGQTRHRCCTRHQPEMSITRDEAFVVVPGWAPKP